MTESLHKRNVLQKKVDKNYNTSARNLKPLKTGTKVLMQNPVTHRWDQSGVVVAVGDKRNYMISCPNGRSYDAVSDGGSRPAQKQSFSKIQNQ